MRESEELWNTIVDNNQRNLVRYTKSAVIDEFTDNEDCNEEANSNHLSKPNSLAEDINKGLIGRLPLKQDLKKHLETTIFNNTEYLSIPLNNRRLD